MSRVLPLLVGLGLSGCWVTSGEVADKLSAVPDTDVDTDEPIDLGPLEVRGLAPTIGTDAGGLEVTVDVGTLDPDDVEVSFGGVPATLVRASAQEVVVETPAVTIEGAVDVVVESADRRERAEGAFYYWADGTDRPGLVGVVENLDYDRGYDLGVGPRYRSARLLYVEPVDFAWWQLYTGVLDTCVRDHVREGPSLSILAPGVAEVVLSGPETDWTLTPDDEGELFLYPLEEGWFPPGAELDLSQVAGDRGWPALDLQGAVALPDDGFRLVEPALDASRAEVPRSPTLRWTGGTPGDYVLVEMLRFDFLGDRVDEVTCALFDDGEHRVPGGVWSGWDPVFAPAVTFRISRVRRGGATLPFNRARVDVYGLHTWYGEGAQGF